MTGILVVDSAKALEYKDQGNAFIKQQDFIKATELYTKAIELDNSKSIFFSNRAFAQLKQDNFQASLNDCDKAIELDSNNIKAYHRRGLSYVGLLEFKKARTDLQKILRCRPGDAAADRALQICEKFIREERFKKAIGGDDSAGAVNYCQSLRLDTYDANTDLAKYEGPKLKLQQLTNDKGEPSGAAVEDMRPEFISSMVTDVFLKGKNIPRKYAAAIVSHADRLFREEPTILELSNAKSPTHTISVCGDTHGQFYDVLNIFRKYGKVNENHTYLFNGDFVDRGSWSCEVALLFYCLKIMYPKNIYLNRGNHETNNMNKIYGFEDECKYKYSQRLFDMFSQSFESLPLGAVINDNYLVMHGGLPSDENCTLNDLKKISRFSQPPKEGAFMELLWSDPFEGEGFGPSQRGLGSAFGRDITENFLRKNQLRKVFRSHEVRMGGVKFEHNGKLVTVFSAPNYCDSQNNLGAIIHVVPGRGKLDQNENDDEDLLVETFEAVEHPSIRPMAYSQGGLGF